MRYKIANQEKEDVVTLELKMDEDGDPVLYAHKDKKRFRILYFHGGHIHLHESVSSLMGFELDEDGRVRIV